MHTFKLTAKQALKIALLGSAFLGSAAILQPLAWVDAAARLFPFRPNGLYTQAGRLGIKEVLAIAPEEPVMLSCERGTPQLKTHPILSNAPTPEAQTPAAQVYYVECVTTKAQAKPTQTVELVSPSCSARLKTLQQPNRIKRITVNDFSHYYRNYPPDRPLQVSLFVQPDQRGRSVMDAKEQMLSISQSVIANCTNVGSVRFNLLESDWDIVYGLMENLVQPFRCSSMDAGMVKVLPWGEYICL